MRDFYIALILCFIPSMSVSAQAQTDLKNFGLVGPVKTLRLQSTEIPLINGKFGDPREKPLQLFTFDKEGHKIEQELHNPDGTLLLRLLEKYDANGFRSEGSEYDGSGKLTWRNTFQYEFDSQGRILTLSIFDRDGNFYERMIMNYDSSGFMTDSTTCDRNGHVTNKSIFTRDRNGALLEFTLLNSNGVVIQRQIPSPTQSVSVENNEDGTLRRRQIRNTPVREDVDSRGNWTKLTSKSVITQSGKSEEI